MKLVKQSILLIAVTFMLASCSYFNHIKTAQNAFNKAAEAENTLKLDPNADASVSPANNYRIARKAIRKVMGDVKDESGKNKFSATKLAKDGLLLNAYTIKGLSEWKLGMYPEALQTARAFEYSFRNDQSVQNQRDFIIMSVLQPLILNDSIKSYTKGLDKTQAKISLSEVDQASYDNLDKGLEIISEKRADLDADHPVQLYLTISQLSLAKNWKDLYDKLKTQLKRGKKNEPSKKEEIDAILSKMEENKTALNTKIVTYFNDLKTVLRSTDHVLYQKWKRAHPNVRGI